MAAPVRFIHHPPAQKLRDVKLFQRAGMAFKTAINTIRGIESSSQYSPLQPLAPFQPELTSRQYDFPVGYNINYIPRGYQTGLIPFSELRGLAENCEMLRLGIETCIDQIATYEWQFSPREDADIDAKDPRILELTEFFKSPDKIHTFSQWIGALVEELLVTDAVSVYRAKNRGGKPYAFELIDGATIFPMIDNDGRRPQFPSPAYQQIIKGTPRADYDTSELLYMPKKVRVYTPYGYSAVEQVIMTARKAINRDAYQLAYFTQGSVPDAVAKMPLEMTPDQIQSFEERFNNMLSGNPSQRKKIPFLPGGAEIAQLKEAILVDKFDEWIARIICFCLSLPPNAFVQQQNRATANSEKQRAEGEGQAPRLAFIKNILDALIADFGPDYAKLIEAKPRDVGKQDPVQQEVVLSGYAKTAIITINEARAELGRDPVAGGDQLLTYTPTGYVPLDAFEQNMEQQQANTEAAAQAKADAAQAGASNKSEAGSGVAGKAAYSRLRKAVRHKPVPLDVRR